MSTQSRKRLGETISPEKYSERPGLIRQHSLSLVVAAIVMMWLLLYWRGDQESHMGAFYGNALADWLGTLLIVIATKYFYEIGSAESRPPHPAGRGALMRFLINHSLTILLILTGTAWATAYARMEANSKSGQVVGNIVSEWVQILGIVVITKYTREARSKEDE
jgi:hypothetical protein